MCFAFEFVSIVITSAENQLLDISFVSLYQATHTVSSLGMGDKISLGALFIGRKLVYYEGLARSMSDCEFCN